MPLLDPRLKIKPWKARVRRGGKCIYLGHFSTKEEAAEAEADFGKLWPKRLDAWDERVKV